MPFLVYRLSRFLRLRLRGWRMPLAVAAFVFLTSWLAMALVEPADSDIAAPGTYWWYFVVTSATVGYGDVFPVSTGGRIVGLYVIVGGIVTLTLLFTQLANALQSIRGRRLRGVVPLDLSDHVVLLGYWPGRTERIVAELTAEGRFQVALCAWDDVPENPLPEQRRVHFVRGDLTHEDVMTRACVQSARTAVIDGRDDNETLAIAVAVDHANPRDPPGRGGPRPGPAGEPSLRQRGRAGRAVAHAVPAERGGHRPRHHPGLQRPHEQRRARQHVLDAGPARFPARHVRRLPDVLRPHVRRDPAGAPRTAGLVVSPPWDTPIPAGTTLYYVARRRIDASQLAAR